MTDARDMLVGAISDAVFAITARGQQTASSRVQIKAASIIGRPGISYRPSITYEIPGDTGMHVVTLYLETENMRRVMRRRGMPVIEAARCDCDHHGILPDLTDRPNVDSRICAHILSAIALSSFAGYVLETP